MFRKNGIRRNLFSNEMVSGNSREQNIQKMPRIMPKTLNRAREFTRKLPPSYTQLLRIAAPSFITINSKWSRKKPKLTCAITLVQTAFRRQPIPA